MKYLIDIGHPAHVHLFKYAALKLIERGNSVMFTCRDREHVLHLLDFYGFKYVNFGKHYKSPMRKILGLLEYDFKMLKTSLKYKPDIFLSHGSIYAAHIAWLKRKPHISFEDTYNLEQIRLYLPFTNYVLTGDYDHLALGKKEIRFPGYHELAYLHPEIFKPDLQVLSSLGLKHDQKYALVRFVGWNASHDFGHAGVSLDNKIKLVTSLSKHLIVFISSESELPDELREYQIQITPEQIHDVLHYAHLFVGESATMASESAILGTPAVYINNSQLGYILELAANGLVHSFTESPQDQSNAIAKALEIARQEHVKKIHAANLQKLMRTKINVCEFLLWLIETYPKSVEEIHSPNFDFGSFI